MAARPLPPPEPDSPHKNTDISGTEEKSVKQPFLDVIGSATRAPGLQKQLYQIIKKGIETSRSLSSHFSQESVVTVSAMRITSSELFDGFHCNGLRFCSTTTARASLGLGGQIESVSCTLMFDADRVSKQ